MSDPQHFDLCIIGAGSGGLSIAAGAAGLGVNVCLVEKGAMGGDCLNTGCVPSKALLAAAKQAHLMTQGAAMGIDPVDPKVDFEEVNDHVKAVIATIAPHDSVERFEGLGVRVFQGEGVFEDKKTLRVGDKLITARKFVIATGSTPFVPPIEGLDQVPYLTNETLFDNRTKPDHLVIIGGGPIGLEMAQAHHRLGCKVTVLEGANILAHDDQELVDIVRSSLIEEGVTLLEKTLVSKVEQDGDLINVFGTKGNEALIVSASHLLVATGRTPNIDALQLDKAGVTYTRRGIDTDKGLRTSNKHIYAIGDVAGSLQFTHMANYQAGLVLRRILFKMPVKQNTNIVPWVTYVEPELAHIGMNEAAARKAYGDKITVAKFDYSGNDRAVATKKTKGMVKAIIGKNGKILGASIVGDQAGELIQMWSLAMSQGQKIKGMTGYISPYPTLSEMNKRAAYVYYQPKLKSKWLHGLVRFLGYFG